MNTKNNELYSVIKKKYIQYIDSEPVLDSNNCEIYAQKETFLKLMTILKKEMSFDMLFDHVIVDHIAKNIFHLVYNLYSTKYNKNIIVIVEVLRTQPIVDTVCKIWKIAEWQERESYDLFGILYNNHPDLRRVFLEDDWVGYPLRKNYQDNFMLEK